MVSADDGSDLPHVIDSFKQHIGCCDNEAEPEYPHPGSLTRGDSLCRRPPFAHESWAPGLEIPSQRRSAIVIRVNEVALSSKP